MGFFPAMEEQYLRVGTPSTSESGLLEPGPPTPSETLDVNAAYKRAMMSSQGNTF